MQSDAPDPVTPPTPDPIKPSILRQNAHTIPLTVVAVCLLACIVTLTLYSKPIDGRLFDALSVVVGAIAGVTWVNNK